MRINSIKNRDKRVEFVYIVVALDRIFVDNSFDQRQKAHDKQNRKIKNSNKGK